MTSSMTKVFVIFTSSQVSRNDSDFIAMDKFDSTSSYVISNVKHDIIQLEIVNAKKPECQEGHEHGRIRNKGKSQTRNHSFGNKILLSMPIGAFFIPSLFVIVAYFYADYSHTLMLPKSRRVPYISDIGNFAPQNGLFAVGLVLSSYFTLAVVVVRFFQIRHFVTKVKSCINILGLIFGILIVVGKILVASFQISEHFITHFAGAGVYVFSTVSYIILQYCVFLKDKTVVGKHRKLLVYIRGFLLVGIICGTLLFGLFILPPLVKYNGPGYSVAQSGEWCFAACKMLFMLTFIAEFWNLEPTFQLSLQGADPVEAEVQVEKLHDVQKL